MYLIVMRHSIRKDLNESDCSITEDGIILAKQRFAELAKYINNKNVLIMSSPFRRTYETCLCLLGMLKQQQQMIIEPLIHEVMTHKGNIPQILEKYISKPKHKSEMRHPDGNARKDAHKDVNKDVNKDVWTDAANRSTLFLEKVKKIKGETNCDTVIAISHGGFINALIKTLDNTHEFDMRATDPSKYIPKYCDYVVLYLNSSEWQIACKNF